MLNIRKLLFCCLCSPVVLVSAGMAGNVLTNGDFAANTSGWSLVTLSGATGDMHADFDGATGNPAGSVKCWIDVNSPSGTNGHRFYQVVPVINGQKYKLSGDWSGDLTGKGVAGTPANWVEVYVGFYNTVPTPDQWGSIAFKKRSDTSPAWNWEPMANSYQTGFDPNGVTAAGSYMVVSFNVGGAAFGVDPTLPAWVNIDNLKVLPCHDVAGSDCSVDFRYLAWLMNNWLVCNIDPPTSCY
jgi:hypothetical protein